MSVRTSYKPGTFCWVDLSAHDMNAAIEFYTAFFGWTARSEDTQGGPPYATFLLGEHAVAGLGQTPDEMKAQGVPPVWSSYVSVEDVAATAARAEELGAKIVLPPMQVVDAGHMAVIADPTGAMLSLWQTNQHFGATLVNDPGAFCWNELNTRDLDAARGFYGELFGWELVSNTSPATGGEYVSIKNQGGENGGMMAIAPEWGDVPPSWGVYFSVEDLPAARAKLKELGGNHVTDVMNIPEVGPFSVATDPQGAVFTLIQLSQYD